MQRLSLGATLRAPETREHGLQHFYCMHFDERPLQRMAARVGTRIAVTWRPTKLTEKQALGDATVGP